MTTPTLRATRHRLAPLTLATVLAAAAPTRAYVPTPPAATAEPTQPPSRVVTAIASPAESRAWEASDARWRAFLRAAGGTWASRLDRRTDRPAVAWGSGLALVPGPGNDLTLADLGLPAGTSLDLGLVEALVRTRFLEPHADLLGADPADLVLDPVASAPLDGGRIWSLDFVHAPGGVPVEQARVGVRINAGNVILFGTVLVADVEPLPELLLDADAALERARLAVGGRAAEAAVTVVERPTLVRTPHVDGVAVASHVPCWRLRFRVPGELETWEARVDAATGDLVTLHDANEYACEPRPVNRAQVIGGVHPESPGTPEVVRALPFVSVVEDGVSVVTDHEGVYDYLGGTARTELAGRFVSVSCVTCTNPPQVFVEDDASGRLDLGTGGNNDEGNGLSTRAERDTFYHANWIRAIATKWLDAGTVPWLDASLPARVNLDRSCNAFWNGTSINMFHAGGACNNTGEVAGVIQHEWGHGVDQATGRAGDGARGEGIGDHMDIFASHDHRIGPFFRVGGGSVRCVDWRACPRGLLTAGNVAAKCPPGGGSPLGREVHCEGEIYGQTGWDLSLELVDRYGQWGGWHVHESIFFPALVPSDTYLPNDVGGAFWAYVTVDDDDGDLTNGTPHAGEIFRAFDLHEIAPAGCAGDPTCPSVSSARCAPPSDTVVSAISTISDVDGASEVELSWPADPAVDHWNVYRTDFEEDDGYVLIADGVSDTTYLDETVINDVSYWYVVQPVGLDGCEALSATPVRVDILLPQLVLDSVTVSDAAGGDGDGVIEPGETVAITASVRNVGTTTATVVAADLTSGDDSLALVTAPSVTYPDIGPGAVEAPLADFEVAITAERFDCGARVPLTVSMTSSDGCWFGSFVLAIGAGAADVSATGFQVLDDGPAGNANGRAEPGEEFELLLELGNAGPLTATAPDIEVRSLDPLLTVVAGLSTGPDVVPGAPVPANSPVRLALDPAAACPSSVTLEVSVVADEGCWTDVVTIPVGRRRVLFADSFETDAGWTYGEPGDTALSGGWTRGIPNQVFVGRPWQPGEDATPGGLLCALTGNEVVAGNPEHADLDFRTTLTSPTIDLTGEDRAELTYAAWVASESPGDRAELLIRVDGGDWQLLRDLSGDAPSWTTHSEDLVALLGAPLGVIELRLAASADPAGGGLFEVALDDVAIGHEDCQPPSPVPGLVLTNLALDDGSGPQGHGNADGVVDPGERLAFVPTIANARNADARNVLVTFRLVDGPPGLLLIDDLATARDLAPGDAAATDAPHFRLLLPPEASCGDALTFELSADYEDAAGVPFFSRLGTFTVPVGVFTPAPCDPFTDPACAEPIVRIGPLHDFEGLTDAGWSHGILFEEGVVLPGNVDDWHRKNPIGIAGDPPSAYDGASVFGTDLRAGGTDAAYQSATHTYLESPAWDASRFSHVRLRYARWLTVQGSDFDVASVLVNGSEIWRNEPVGPHVDSTCVDPFGGDATYSSDELAGPDGPAGWKLVEHDVSALADHRPDVVARWDLLTDRQCEYGGWSIDAVQLVGVPDTPECAAFDPCTTPVVLSVAADPPTARLTCAQTGVSLAVTAEGDGELGYVYRWSPTVGVSDPDAPVTTVTRAGDYVVTVTDLVTGCEVSSEPFTVERFVEPPVPTATVTGVIDCTGTPVTLSVEVVGGDGSEGHAYDWFGAGPVADPNAPVTTVAQEGTWACRVTDLATGCVATSNPVQVTADLRAPVAGAGEDKVSVCFAPVVLDGTASGGNGALGHAYSWSPPEDLSDPASPTPTTSAPGTYVLTVTDLANGCTDTDEVVVTDAGDRLPPEPVGTSLRVRRDGPDVILDLGRYGWGEPHTWVVFRDIRPGTLNDDLLALGHPLQVQAGVVGPEVVDFGQAGPAAARRLFYRVHVVSGCGLESR